MRKAKLSKQKTLGSYNIDKKNNLVVMTYKIMSWWHKNNIAVMVTEPNKFTQETFPFGLGCSEQELKYGGRGMDGVLLVEESH